MALPPLPDAFADCAGNVVAAGPTASGFTPLADVLGSDLLDVGLDGLNSKWGPGDRRAVVSLWTQGYFGRLLRPLLAYGLLHNLWFRMDIGAVGIGLSDIGTPVRFKLETAKPRGLESWIEHFIEDHAGPLIDRLVQSTGTSERIHWSNASFAFHRALLQVAAVADESRQPEDVLARIAAIWRITEGDHPLYKLTELQDNEAGESRLVRRVCCIRFKLECLKKCGTVCPMRADEPVVNRSNVPAG